MNFNCKKNTNDKCLENTICNESGICVCNDFHFGINCEKKLQNLTSLSLNKGLESTSFLTIVLCISILSPVTLALGFFLIFIFLKGRDGTYIN